MSNDLVETSPSAEGRAAAPDLPAVVEAIVPLLRGRLHQICFFLAFPAGALVIASAQSTRARTAAVVYAIGVCACWCERSYHRGKWSAVARPRMKRLDHATIFIMIAASYTPMCMLTLGGELGSRVLLGAWLGGGWGWRSR